MRQLAKILAFATVLTAFAITAILVTNIITDATTELKEAEDHSPNFPQALLQEADSDELRIIGTAIAIAAVVVAWYKFDIFREFEPHLTIEQSVHSRSLGQSFRLVVATATLTNNSKVLVIPREGYCRLAQLSPLQDRDVIDIYQQSLIANDDNLEQFGWPVLNEVKRTWPAGDIAIEPGECHQETYQFVIDGNVQSVVALTTIYNPAFLRGSTGRAETWRCYTFHDI